MITYNYNLTIFERIKKTWFTRDFMLFVFCGGMGTLTNFICSLAVSTILNPAVSYIFGYGISLFVTYALNTKLIFHRNFSVTELVKFVISYIPNFLILFTFVLIFLDILHWNKVIVYALAGLFGLPLTFLLVKLFAFGKGDKR